MAIESKSWDWKVVQGSHADFWRRPCEEVYYLASRWRSDDKKDFLDLGCGIGRHSIFFAANDFKVSAFDLSEEGIKQTEQWAESENLPIDCRVGDMLKLPYEDESFDCILTFHVISHTDTEGMKKIVSEIKRVLRKDGECYMTLGSKDTWGWKYTDWPLIDENTKRRLEEGPENNVPHFYADYNLCQELFSDFEIVDIHQKIEYIKPTKKADAHISKEGNVGKDKEIGVSYHYHLLIRKK